MSDDLPIHMLTRPAIRARLKKLSAARRAELRATPERETGRSAYA